MKLPISALLALLPSLALAADRPNILWIVSEDNNPYIGAYGDPVARTPTIDKLAKEGILYENCFSAAPVCAPSRFTLISGINASGCAPANQMRAQGKIPAALKGFPIYLRQAGYYCTNNAKTDYNAPISPKEVWDESSKNAHWKNRPAGKPFFAVFNHEMTHESCMFRYNRSESGRCDPAKVRIPAYCPDTPETRRDRAHYYDQMNKLDGQVARLLAQLEADGLTDDTIVFYYGDNGGVLPRSKRFCYDSGLHVPLIVKFPAKWQKLASAAPGSRIDSPVGFVDFAPTVLSLAGVEAPAYLQGKAFLGPKNAGPQTYAFSFRNRMDERYDFVRTARDKQYRYVRNYNPHVPYGQHVQYMFQQTGVKQWHELFTQGKLNDAQKRFWLPKPAQELYDLTKDPDEIHNLAESPEHQAVLQRMRGALREHMLAIRDNGFIPEGCAAEGYDACRDEKLYPLARVIDVADVAIARDPANLPKLLEAMRDPNEVIRYWGVMGCLMLRDQAAGAKGELIKALQDACPQVRVPAAEALVWMGETEKGLAALGGLLQAENSSVRLQTLNAIDHIGGQARPLLPAVTAAVKDPNNYVQRASKTASAVLLGKDPSASEAK